MKPTSASPDAPAMFWSPMWPRDLIEPDLLVECAESELDGHHHLAHTFPLYVLSAYFQKAILFENRSATGFSPKRMRLPFPCSVVRELLNFAYDGRLESLREDNYGELLAAADYTMALRMKQYLRQMHETFIVDQAAEQPEQKEQSEQKPPEE